MPESFASISAGWGDRDVPNPLDMLAPVGGDSLVNSTTANFQSGPAVAFLADGSYVIVFQSLDDEGYNDVRARIFSADGVAAGPDFQVNATIASEQDLPQVAALADGGFVVVWEDLSSGTSFDIKARIYRADGSAGGEVTVAGSATGETSPTVAALPGGGFVVTWSDDGDPEGDIKAQICGADASPAGSAFAVNETMAGSQYNAAVAVLADGTIVMVWQDSSVGDIRMRLFSPAGGAITGEIGVTDGLAGAPSLPGVVALTGGGFAIAWVDGSGDADGSGIRARLFAAGGEPAGASFAVNTLTAGDQQLPALAALPDGGFVVGWSDGAGGASADDIRAQRFDAGGNPVDAEFVVNAHIEGFQTYPALAADRASGTLVVAWADTAASGIGDDDGAVLQRLFTPGGVAPSANTPPEARDDMLAAAEDLPATYDPHMLLANDSDRDGDLLRVTAVSGAANGSVVLNGDGTITFTSSPNFDGIAGFDYEVSDGNGGTATAHAMIEVAGAPDPAIIGGADTGEVAEDGALVATGALTISDSDAGESAFRPLAGAAGSYGLFHLLENGSWHYSLDNNNEFVQALSEGDTLSDTITIMSVDGTAHDLTITISGANESEPLMLDHPIPDQHGTEDVAVSYQVPADTFSDPENDPLAYAATLANGDPLPSWLSFDPDTRTFSGMPPLNFNGTIALLVTAGDGTTSTSDMFDLIIDPVNDAPAIGGTDTGTVTEDGAGSANGALTISDPDAGESAFQPVAAGTAGDNGYGTFAMSADGSWTYSLDNTDPAVQALAGGGTLHDTITVLSADGTPHILDVTINGADEPPPPLPPTVDLNGANAGIGHQAAFTEGSAGTAIGADIAVTAPNLPITRATVTVTDAAAADSLILAGALPATITVLSGAGTAQLVLAGAGTAADWAAALAQVRYVSASDNPDSFGADPMRTISVVVGDGLHDSAPAVATVAITPVNDDPLLSGFGDPVTFTEGDSYVLLDANGDAAVTDPDSMNFGGGSISFGMLTGATAHDLIFITATGGISLSGTDVLHGGVTIGSISSQGPGQFLTVDFNADATPADVQALVRALAYTNLGGDAPAAGQRSIAYILKDGDGGASGGGVNVDVVAVNDAPSGADHVVSAVEDSAYVFAVADFGFSDPDHHNFASVKVATRPAAGTLLLNGSAVQAGDVIAVAEIQAGHLTFLAAANANGTGYASFTFQVADDSGSANLDPSPNTITIDVAPVNDPPAGTDATITLVEDAPRLLASADFGFTDPDGGDAFSAVTITGVTGGTLYYDADGTAGAGLPVAVGSFPQTYTAAQLAAGNVSFRANPNLSGTGVATLSFQVVDNSGAANNTGPTANALTFDVTPVNDAPTSTLLANDTRTWTEGNGFVTLDVLGNATLADIDSADFDTGSLTVAINVPRTEDILGIVNTAIVTTSGNAVSVNGVAIGTFSGGAAGTALVFAFNADATPARVQELIHAIGYSNGGGDIPTAGLRTLTWTFNDGDGNANGGNPALALTSRVNVVPVNDPPSGADVTVAINEDQVYHFSTADFAFSDVEGNSPAGVRVESLPAHGTLFFDPDGNGSIAAFEANVGLTIGWSSIQAGNFYYVPGANQNGAGFDSFTFAVVDSGGAADTTPNIFTFDAAAVNDPPSGTDKTIVINEDNPYTLTVADFGFNDIDGDDIEAVIFSYPPSGGTLFINGNPMASATLVYVHTINSGNVVFVPAANANGAIGGITFTVRDDGGFDNGGWAADTSPNVLSFQVTPVNDAPVVTTSAGTTAYVESVNAAPGSMRVDSGLTVADVDDTALLSGTVSITAGFEAGADILEFENVSSATFGNIAATYDAGTGVLTLTSAGGTATVAQWQSALRSVRYSNSSEEPSQATRTVSFAVNDGDVTSIAATHQLSVTARNDSPSGTSATLAIAEDTATVLTLAHFGFSDIDGDSFSGLHIAAPPIGGSLYLDTDGPGGSAPGKLINYPTLLTAASIAAGQISFVPDANLNGTGAASFAFNVVDDGSAGLGQNMDPSANTLTFDIAPFDDGPTLAATAGNPTFTEGGGAVDLFSGVTASTVEAGQEVTALTLTVTHVTNGAAEILSFDGSDVALTDGNSVTTATNGLIVTVSVSGTTATVAFSGASLDAAEVQALVDGLSYRNTSQAPGLQSRAVTITQLVDSGSNAAPDSNVSAPGVVSTVTIYADNDAPTVSFASGLAAIEQTPLDLKGKIAIDDLDAGSGTMFVTLYIPSGNISVDVGATGVAVSENNSSFVTFTGTLAQLQALFGSSPGSSIVYTTVSNSPGAPAPVTLRVYDFGNSGTGSNVTEVLGSIAIVPVNDAPSGADKSVTIFEDQPRTFSAADFGFTDVDGHSFAGIVVTTVPGAGTVFLDAVALAAGAFVSAADIAAGRLTFVPALDASGAPLTGFTFQVRDSGGTTDNGVDTDPTANSFTVTVTALNDAPTATGLQGNLATFTEGGGPVLIDVGADAVLADVDSANFTLGKLIVAIGGGGVSSEDVLGIRTDSVVTTSGIQIHVNGVFIATMSGGSGGANLVITLNSSEDTVANVQEVLRHIVYSNSNADNPTPGQRQLTITLSDGDGTANGGQDTLTATSAIDVVAVNDAPQGADATRTASEDDPYVFALADFAIADAEGNAVQSVYLTTAPTHGTIYVDGNIVQAVGATIGADLIQAGRVTFLPEADQFGSPYASFTFQLIDAGGATDPTPNNFNFNVTPDNLPPAVDLDGGGAGNGYAGSYTEGGAAASIGAAILVSDVDEGTGDQIESATVTLTNAEVGDFLTYGTLPAGISAAIATPAGQIVLTFTGAASAAAYAALLADVRYATTSDTPSVLARIITVTVNDGAAGSSAATATISVTPTDDAPVAYDHAYIIGEAAMIAGNVFTDTGSGSDTDPDGPAPTVASVNGSSANVGQQLLLDSGALLTVNADGTFTYHTNHSFDRTPTGNSGASNAAPVDSFTYTLAGGSGATVTLNIQGVDTDDTLRGTAGSDTLSGGNGDDLYYVENAGDRVIELGLYGNDRVVASASWALTANSEVETVEAAAGTAAINLTGNSLAQTLIGNAGSNILHGGGGADVLRGLGGDDTYYADVASVQVQEAAGGGTDRLFVSVSYALAGGSEIEVLSTNSHAATAAINLTGNSFNQTLIGNAGENVLHGGGGTDLLIGLGGRDIYYADVASTSIVEYEGGGNDALYVSVSYVLVNGEVEVLSTNNHAATSAINLTGNLYNQTLIGNAGNNVLNGGGGTDLLIGLAGNDTYYIDVSSTQIVEYEGGGNDALYVSSSYVLVNGEVETLSVNDYGSTQALNLTGNLYAQTLIGNAGNNILNGGGGVDTLIGLGGNDTYYIDVAGTQAYEAAGAGTDALYTSVSYALAAGSEIETLSSNNYGATSALSLTGNASAQTLIGNAGANALDGGAGADTLLGLGGADVFRFTAALGGGNVDAIGDFSVADDTIALDDAVFTQIGGLGALNANAFVTGSAAADADDRIIYDSATGQLFYDADGNGIGAAVQFATLASGLALTANDFQVI
jgi:VCBS repeat-containing protein